ncbi:MAG: DNA polymerase I [Candidatus Omnitrophica bacterium]|nr:DNA polymerase I [Candidatus Omnitrophota bacterium]
MASERLFLIDGHALCYRSFYAIRELRASNGQATNAVYGFVKTLQKLITDYNPHYVAVCFDSKEQTLRQKKYADYKIQRQPMPDDLISQIPIIKDVLAAFHIAAYECPGYEADDLIATFVERADENKIDVVVVSDDKDMYQLARESVQFLSPSKGVLLDQKGLTKKLGFSPVYMADFLALAGDASDNIPGVKGIGKVTATQLIAEFGGLQDVFDNLENVSKVKVKEKLEAEKEAAFLSKDLAVLEDKVPVDFSMNALKVGTPDADKLFEMFKTLEFRRLAAEYSGGYDTDADCDVRSLTEDQEIETYAKSLKDCKTVAILFEDNTDGELFGTGKIYLTGDGKDIVVLSAEKASHLKSGFAATGQTKIVHGLKEFLKKDYTGYFHLEDDVFDILLAGFLLAPAQSSYAPADLSWHYLKESLPEDHHAGYKVRTLFKLYPVLKKELEDVQLTGLLNDLELPLTRVLSKMEMEGVNIDVPLLAQLSKECERKLENLTDQLYKMAGEEFNINSPKQLSQILFEKLKLPVIKKTKTGFSTDESVLTILANQHDFPLSILEYRQIAKLKSTYIDALPKLVNPETKRIHAEFDQIGTETGRLSSRHPNLQNIPIRTELGREIRKAIIPAKGNILIAADYSQIELRILAHLSKDENLLKAFNEEQDIHAYTASLIFDVDEKDVDYNMRDTAKRVNFGITYGMSAFGLAKDLKITNPEAQEFITKYFTRYPKVKQFMDDQIAQCQDKGYVVTLLNRRRYIPEINSKNNGLRQFAQRQAINTPVQGSAADLMKLAMIKMQDAIEEKKFKSKMISTVHDELVFDAVKTEKDDLIQLIRKIMEHPMALDVPIKVSVKVGQNWLETETV